MKIEINNRQELRRANRRRIRALARFFMAKTAHPSRDPGWAELSLVLADHRVMEAVNRRHLDTAGTTDVIAFRYLPIPGDRGRPGGEIFVNVALAVEAARKKRQPALASRELALYIAHGCDHLAGATDSTRIGYGRMRRREQRWLRQADALRLLDGLLLR